MEEAVQAHRVVVMDDGKVEMDGTPREIFSQVERMKTLGLDVPAATALAHSLGMPSNIITNDEFILCYKKIKEKNYA